MEEENVFEEENNLMDNSNLDDDEDLLQNFEGIPRFSIVDLLD